MTVNQAIQQLVAIRDGGGGELRVGCWPYDGQMLHSGFFDDATFDIYEDAKLTIRDRLRYTTKTETVVMIDHQENLS